MALTDDDLKAIGTLMEQTFDRKVEPFRHEVNGRFDEMQTQIEGLYQRDEKREQEYLFMKEQLGRVEETASRIEKKVDQHDQYFDDMDARVTDLEKKSA